MQTGASAWLEENSRKEEELESSGMQLSCKYRDGVNTCKTMQKANLEFTIQRCRECELPHWLREREGEREMGKGGIEADTMAKSS